MYNGASTGVGRCRSNAREVEYFCTSVSDNIILYGLFGDCKDKVASKYAAKHLPIEFLNLWKEQVDKPDIEMMLKTVFEIIETRLLQQHAGQKIDGTSALVAVIYGSDLFVAHTGCGRALLYIKKENITYVNQLLMEHNLKNSKELKRICDLGVEKTHLSSESFFGYPYTRCLGNVTLKKFFCSFSALSNLVSSPWTAVPDIIGPIKLTDNSLMLVMFCNGITKYLSGLGYLSSEINNEVISRINHQLSLQPTLTNVAQALVDEIVFMPSTPKQFFPGNLDSSTLIIHGFQNLFVTSFSNDQFLSTLNCLEPLSVDVKEGEFNESQMRSYNFSPHSSKSANESFSKSPSRSSKLLLDENGQIAPYVDFSFYYVSLDQLEADNEFDGHSDLKALLDFEKNSRDIINS